MVNKVKKPFIELLKTTLWAIVIAMIFRSFLFEPFSIPSGSMIPTLRIGDYLFVSKFSYGYSKYSFPFGIIPFSGRVFENQPERGDVIVFRRPGQENVDFIKRLIGLPGDQVQVIDSVVYINDVALVRTPIDETSHSSLETFLRNENIKAFTETLPSGKTYTVFENDSIFGNSLSNDTRVFTVPEGHYFFMGDNRDRSNDSRMGVGMVPARNLIGRAEFLFFSHNGKAHLWEVWRWPFAIRFKRIGRGIE